MQLLPSVGKTMAREEGISTFPDLPTPRSRPPTSALERAICARCSTSFGGVKEYALAAYNAGDNRVVDWQAAGPYSGIDEFVESIPFTETREYVEAILRNKEIYKAIDARSLRRPAKQRRGRGRGADDSVGWGSLQGESPTILPFIDCRLTCTPSLLATLFATGSSGSRCHSQPALS